MARTAMTDIERLAHIESIKRLKARYFRTLDTEDWDALETVFTDDVTVAFPGRRALTSRLELLDALRTHHTEAEVVTVHHGHMPEIDVLDDCCATGTWAMSDLVDRIWHADGRRERFAGFGHYHDRFVRTAAGWLMSSMRLTRLRVDWLPVRPDAPFPHRGAPAVDVHRQR